MFRYASSVPAAAAMILGAVSALSAEAPSKVTINTKGDYCITSDAITGTRIPSSESHSVATWAKQGMTFSIKPHQIASR